MPAELFMRVGQAALVARSASHLQVGVRGALNLDWLSKAASQIPGIPWREKWSDFARVTACNQMTFNAEAAKVVVPDEYIAYQFNPLRRRPVIDVGEGRYIAVDPSLVVERITWGIFYDVFERYQDLNAIWRFTEPFGYAFERFVDNLLKSVLPAPSLWRETESPRVGRIKRGECRPQHKVGDMAYRSALHPVLIECASLRPMRDLCTMASKKYLDKVAGQVAEELCQAFEHIRSIQTSAWTEEGLGQGQWVALLVTFGRFETINFIFFRDLIKTKLKEQGIEEPGPFLVLSLQEMDSVVRLVESGKDFGALIAEFASNPSCDPLLERYEAQMSCDAVSSFAKSKMKRMYDFLPSTDAEEDVD